MIQSRELTGAANTPGQRSKVWFARPVSGDTFRGPLKWSGSRELGAPPLGLSKKGHLQLWTQCPVRSMAVAEEGDFPTLTILTLSQT